MSSSFGTQRPPIIVEEEDEVSAQTTTAAGSDISCSSTTTTTSAATTTTAATAYPCISACELHDLFSSGQESTVSLVDIRTLAAYAASHIKSAVDVQLSSILLRRLAKGSLSVWELVSLKHRTHFKDATLRLHRKVVVYDAASTCPGAQGSVLSTFLDAFQREKVSVSFLLGGFDAFKASGPHTHLQAQALSPPPLQLQRPRENKPAPLSAPATNASQSFTFAPPRIAPSGSGQGCAIFGQPPSRVCDHLYIGSMEDARNRTLLASLGIGYVLNVTSDCANFYENDGIAYKRVPIDDTWQQNISVHFGPCIDFINQAQANGSRVLVHCKAGVSRSPTMVIAYLMNARKMTLSEAYSTVRAVRPFISPNLDFMGHLIQYQKSLEGRASIADLFAMALPAAAAAAAAVVAMDEDETSLQEDLEVAAAVCMSFASSASSTPTSATSLCSAVSGSSTQRPLTIFTATRNLHSPYSLKTSPSSPSVCHSPLGPPSMVIS